MQDVLAQIDKEISKLQQARALLAGTPDAPVAAPKVGRGRPKGSRNTAIAPPPAAPAKKGKRQLTPEGRKAIADAMTRRWAEKRSSK